MCLVVGVGLCSSSVALAASPAQPPKTSSTPTTPAQPDPDQQIKPAPFRRPAEDLSVTKIKPGIRVADIDLGGLSLSEATARLRKELTRRLSAPISVKYGKQVTRFSTRSLAYRFDPAKTAAAALYISRTQPEQVIDTDVKAAVSYNAKALEEFIRSVSKKHNVPARNAAIKITVHRIFTTHERRGRKVVENVLRTRLRAALRNPLAPHVINVPMVRTLPRHYFRHLRRPFHTVLTIDRGKRQLHLFKNFRKVRTLQVAVGQPRYPTPAGNFRIINKAVNPVWTAPRSPWTGKLAGQQFAGGIASNPLKARWLGITPDVGVHGTSADYSIGSAASHGCIRMRVKDVIWLYGRVPVGTHVLIK